MVRLFCLRGAFPFSHYPRHHICKQKLCEITQKARIEVKQLETLLREKQISVESNQKEIEMQKIEKDNMEKRLLEVNLTALRHLVELHLILFYFFQIMIFFLYG